MKTKIKKAKTPRKAKGKRAAPAANGAIDLGQVVTTSSLEFIRSNGRESKYAELTEAVKKLKIGQSRVVDPHTKDPVAIKTFHNRLGMHLRKNKVEPAEGKFKVRTTTTGMISVNVVALKDKK